MQAGIKKSWRKMLERYGAFELADSIYNSSSTVYPPKDDIFNCFKYFRMKETKVVLLGQDPYIRQNQAIGMAFAVPPSERIPPSLKNIYKELSESVEDFSIPNHGDISRWNREEKVLLLNTALTVLEGKSNSHKKQWEDITNRIIRKISKKCDKVIFILLGNNAKKKIKFIDNSKHTIISGVHPSPLSANYNLKGTNKSFFGHNIFKRVNDELEKNNITPICWKVA